MNREDVADSRRVYQGSVFDVYEDDLILADGRIGRRSRIVHRPTVSVVPVTEEGSVLMIRQYRPAVGKYLIEIPAGRVNGDQETPEACAQREMAEEIGYGAKRLVKLFEGYLVPGYGDEYMHYFLAMDLYRKSLPADEDEQIEPFEVRLEAALRMVLTGQIVDSKTALGLLMAREHLR